MGSFSLNASSTPEACFREVQGEIGSSGMEIKSVTPNQSILVEGEREYSLGLLIVLLLLFWPAALIYYFAAGRNTMSVSITEKGEWCSITATSSGKKADELLERIHAAVTDNTKEKGILRD